MPVPWTFWLRWTFLTTVGLGVGLVAGFGLGAPTVAIVGMMLVVTVIGAILGGVSGAVQSFGLPPRVSRRGSWALATAAGMGRSRPRTPRWEADRHLTAQVRC